MRYFANRATIALVSSLTLVAWGALSISSAQELPPGSYARTCRDAGVVDNVLVAVCQRADGSWKNAALPNPERCTDGVTNSNGSLVCAATQVQSAYRSYPGQTRLAAILPTRGDDVTFFFRDGSFAVYNMAADRMLDGFPRSSYSADYYPGLAPYAQMISSAFHQYLNNKFYFFLTDGTYIRYDLDAHHVDPGYPGPVDERSWPGLSAYASRITCALNWPGNKIQFILNDGTYIRYDLVADRADRGYPQLIDRNWPGVGPYVGDIAGCFSANNGKAYFFLRDGRYLRYDVASDRLDPGYPGPIDEKSWSGLAPYLR